MFIIKVMIYLLLVWGTGLFNISQFYLYSSYLLDSAGGNAFFVVLLLHPESVLWFCVILCHSLKVLEKEMLI